MSMTDPIADMLTSIRNGQRVRLARVGARSSRINKGILDVLQREGYIKSYDEEEIRKGVKRLNIDLQYHEGQPVIQMIKRTSKPGLRRYSSKDGFPKIYNGLGISILSTSKGILADHEARTQNVGGELLCSVF